MNEADKKEQRLPNEDEVVEAFYRLTALLVKTSQKLSGNPNENIDIVAALDKGAKYYLDFEMEHGSAEMVERTLEKIRKSPNILEAIKKLEAATPKLIAEIKSGGTADSITAGDLFLSKDAQKRLLEIARTKPQKVTVIKPDGLYYALDKVTNSLFSGVFNDEDKTEPVKEAIIDITNSSQRGKTTPAEVSVQIDWNHVPEEIARKLGGEDRLVYSSVCSYFMAGNDVLSIHDIRQSTGITSTDRIYEILSKMRMLSFTLDNSKEAAKYKRKKYTKYDGYLLPVEMISSVEFNGGISESAVHILKTPPLLAFATRDPDKPQMTMFRLDQLNARRTHGALIGKGVSLTESMADVYAYLLQRIGRMRGRGRVSKVIRLVSIYDHVGFDPKKNRTQTARKKEQIFACLDLLQKNGEITGYNQDPDGSKIRINT